MPWLVTLFFGAVAVVGLMMLAGSGSALTLGSEGFHVKQLGRDMGFTNWLECSDFGVASISHNKMVVYDRLQDEGKTITNVNRALVGGSASLPDTYGMKPQKLADLMNAYREKALREVY